MLLVLSVAEEAAAALLLLLRLLRCAASEETGAGRCVLRRVGAASTKEAGGLRLVLGGRVAEEGGHLGGIFSDVAGGRDLVVSDSLMLIGARREDESIRGRG